MEDNHAAEINLIPDSPYEYAFFAVFDGHGGETVAKLAGSQLHRSIQSQSFFQASRFKEAIQAGYLDMDSALRVHPEMEGDPSGSTAVSALFTPEALYVGNAGDSRAVLSVRDQPVIPMSFDHKPSNHTEAERIFAAGGFLDYGRVNGNLALSRALGDFEFKQNRDLPPESQIVTAYPDITEHLWTSNDEFLILACDGIWDCLSNEQCVHFVRYHLASGLKLKEICELLMDHCLAPSASVWGAVGCDNMTVIIVALLHGHSDDEWYSWMQSHYTSLLNEPLPEPMRRMGETIDEISSSASDPSSGPFVEVQ